MPQTTSPTNAAFKQRAAEQYGRIDFRRIIMGWAIESASSDKKTGKMHRTCLFPVCISSGWKHSLPLNGSLDG